ncbi:required for meiotic nuclear division protein 1 homolog [Octopus sinensis]|uniref:Required for meiotic nuclear division protein 1 homolog n=1 Tax=Octopus sinensis TaxID=2607531 RepID=A0A6P7SWV6_9MOLL|nr:required for meiotic nuclear division protein 1 homolog [Octopus sinensis]
MNHFSRGPLQLLRSRSFLAPSKKPLHHSVRGPTDFTRKALQPANFVKEHLFKFGWLNKNFVSAFHHRTNVWAAAAARSKPVSPLTSKMTPRKKPVEVVDVDKLDVVAYAISEDIRLEELSKAFVKQALYEVVALPIDVTDGLHLKAIYKIDDKEREIFLFREGAIVFWNMSVTERNEVLHFIEKYSASPYASSLYLTENECLKYDYSADRRTCLEKDVIHINVADQFDSLVKYAFSNALSLSVKLAIWEDSLVRFVDTIEPVIEDVRLGKRIRVSRDQILRMTGELFTLRHLINLSSDLLDTPDFYWDRENLEPLYQKMSNYLSINRRTKVINEKLKHCCELTELLSSHLNDKHHTRLEWMIIILILVEVMFECIHYAEKYYSH